MVHEWRLGSACRPEQGPIEFRVRYPEIMGPIAVHGTWRRVRDVDDGASPWLHARPSDAPSSAAAEDERPTEPEPTLITPAPIAGRTVAEKPRPPQISCRLRMTPGLLRFAGPLRVGVPARLPFLLENPGPHPLQLGRLEVIDEVGASVPWMRVELPEGASPTMAPSQRLTANLVATPEARLPSRPVPWRWTLRHHQADGILASVGLIDSISVIEVPPPQQHELLVMLEGSTGPLLAGVGQAFAKRPAPLGEAPEADALWASVFVPEVLRVSPRGEEWLFGRLGIEAVRGAISTDKPRTLILSPFDLLESESAERLDEASDAPSFSVADAHGEEQWVVAQRADILTAACRALKDRLVSGAPGRVGLALLPSPALTEVHLDLLCYCVHQATGHAPHSLEIDRNAAMLVSLIGQLEARDRVCVVDIGAEVTTLSVHRLHQTTGAGRPALLVETETCAIARQGESAFRSQVADEWLLPRCAPKADDSEVSKRAPSQSGTPRAPGDLNERLWLFDPQLRRAHLATLRDESLAPPAPSTAEAPTSPVNVAGRSLASLDPRARQWLHLLLAGVIATMDRLDGQRLSELPHLAKPLAGLDQCMSLGVMRAQIAETVVDSRAVDQVRQRFSTHLADAFARWFEKATDAKGAVLIVASTDALLSQALGRQLESRFGFSHFTGVDRSAALAGGLKYYQGLRFGGRDLDIEVAPGFDRVRVAVESQFAESPALIEAGWPMAWAVNYLPVERPACLLFFRDWHQSPTTAVRSSCALDGQYYRGGRSFEALWRAYGNALALRISVETHVTERRRTVMAELVHLPQGVEAARARLHDARKAWAESPAARACFASAGRSAAARYAVLDRAMKGKHRADPRSMGIEEEILSLSPFEFRGYPGLLSQVPVAADG